MRVKHFVARAWSTEQRPGDGGKVDRDAVSQGESRMFTRSDDETRAGCQPGSGQNV